MRSKHETANTCSVPWFTEDIGPIVLVPIEILKCKVESVHKW